MSQYLGSYSSRNRLGEVGAFESGRRGGTDLVERLCGGAGGEATATKV